MQRGSHRGAAGAPEHGACRHRFGGLVAVVLLGSIAGACTHDRPGTPLATAEGAAGATVAFESIDGPPLGVFNRLVEKLGEEADARQLAVVTREGPAQYRVRGYLAVHVERKRTVVAWVWDVYDSAQRRALRITGEEAAPRTRTPRQAWAIADDKLLRRIAQASMDNLLAFLGPAAPGPDRPGAGTVAANLPPGALALAER